MLAKITANLTMIPLVITEYKTKTHSHTNEIPLEVSAPEKPQDLLLCFRSKTRFFSVFLYTDFRRNLPEIMLNWEF